MIRRLLGVMLWHAGGKPSVRAGEQMARMTLYGTTGRSVMGVPVKRPRDADTPAAMTRGDDSDEQHRNP